jgi:cystathionine gamma-synthase
LQEHANDSLSNGAAKQNVTNGLNGTDVFRRNGSNAVHEQIGVEIHSVSFEVQDAQFFTDFHGTGHRIVLSIVAFPNTLQTQASIFWRLTGLGISSRLARQCLKSLHKAVEVTSIPPSFFSLDHTGVWALEQIQGRIAGVLGRTVVRSQTPVTSKDVYLYQTGMAAIYHTQKLLTKLRPDSQSIVFGFPYELTLTLVEEYGHSTKFFGFGTPEELEELAKFVETLYLQNRSIQALWCEIPSNPLLRTVDLRAIRRLGDRYDFPVIVDDTIGTFLNVDILEVADVIVTSLTKAFSGFANVMGGRYINHPMSVRFSLIHNDII